MNPASLAYLICDLSMSELVISTSPANFISLNAVMNSGPPEIGLLMIRVCDQANLPAIRHWDSNPAVSWAASDPEAAGGFFPVPPASSADIAHPFAIENWSDESHAHAYQGLRTESGRERTVREPARR